MADDRELYELFAQGNRDAFETLFSRYQREVFGWIYRIVRDQGDAEDLTVETFWKIYAARARFDPAKSFGAWARRIATNLALSRLRRSRRHEPLLFEPSAPRTADPAESQHLRLAIESAMAELSPKLHVVATLALVEEMPYEEIAEALGLSREAVKSRVFRALKKLRRSLEGKGIEP